MKLNELLLSVGQSVQEAHRGIENASIAKFLEYFNEIPRSIANGDETHETTLLPITKNITLRQTDDEATTVDLPIMTLLNHSTFALEQVNIKMNVNFSIDEENRALQVDVIGFDKKDEYTSQIELTFGRNDCSEGVARLNQEAVSII